MGLELVRERCAGIDVHKRQITVCAQVPRQQETREFATDTAALLTVVDWLQELKIDEVAMEATGSYWKPVYNLLEAAGMRPIVGNASHMKAVPGRKTDTKDAEWICDLHRHGLIKASFIPARAQRELRELVGYRSTLVAERASEANRISKVLEGGNINSGRWSRTSSASPAATCLPRWPPAWRTPRSWRTWPRGGYAPSTTICCLRCMAG